MKSVEDGQNLITSVPLHTSRQKKRGYNQSELLARSLAGLLRLEYSGKVLNRIRNTAPQFKLPKEQRQENIKNAFTIINSEKIKDKTVFIIDDITTTGSTLVECARVLKRGGVKKVYGIALGHEEK